MSQEHSNGAESPTAAADAAEAETVPAADQLAQLEAERNDLKDKLLRTLAEMENLRRRTEREAADAKAYAVTAFARDMLAVADNLRRGLDAVPADAAIEPAVKAVVEGVELTEKELLKTLERHGVRKLEPLGQKFDPNLHQAIFEAPDPVHAKGMVAAVVQTGYSIGDRVLRPALVGVSSGASKPAEPPAPGEAAQGSSHGPGPDRS